MPEPEGAPLTSPEAAKRLGVTVRTLSYWRCRHMGPRYVRVSGSPYGQVRYRPADLDAYLAANTVDPEG